MPVVREIRGGARRQRPPAYCVLSHDLRGDGFECSPASSIALRNNSNDATTPIPSPWQSDSLVCVKTRRHSLGGFDTFSSTETRRRRRHQTTTTTPYSTQLAPPEATDCCHHTTTKTHLLSTTCSHEQEGLSAFELPQHHTHAHTCRNPSDRARNLDEQRATPNSTKKVLSLLLLPVVAFCCSPACGPLSCLGRILPPPS